MIRIILVMLALAGPVLGQGVEPPRGSEMRRDILDAIRQVAEFDLGPPVEFVVSTLRVDDNVAFAQLNAQRPGGAPIDMSQIPLVIRDGEAPDLIDGPRIEAFLVQAKGAWFVVDHATGATDVWWFGYRCEVFAGVLPPQAC